MNKLKERWNKLPRQGKIAVSIAAVVIVLLVCIFVYAYGKLNTIHDGNVKIVDKDKSVTDDVYGNIGSMSLEEMEKAFANMSPEEIERIFGDASVDAQDAGYEEDIYKVEQIDKDVLNILLIGQDARPGEKRARSDTMIMASYNYKEKRVVLTSFLRDTWVPIEGFSWYKLNTAYALGGAGLTINTINELYGLDIQYYVVVDFDGLIDIVDALGGIELNITQEESDFYLQRYPDNGKVPVGENVTLTGAQVLGHANNRFIGNNDFARTQRQRDILMAIYKKVKGINNPSEIMNLANIGLSKVKTNMPVSDIISLGFQALGLDNLTIDQARVPFDGMWYDAKQGAQSVIMCDYAENAAELKKIIYGDDSEEKEAQNGEAEENTSNK